MVNVPVRCAPGFAAAAYVTLPEPLPEGGLGLVMDNQSTLAAAVHGQCAGPLTAIALPGPPDDGTVSLVADNVSVHPPPSWPRVNVCPPTMTVPDRGGPGLGGMDSCTVAVPLPA